MFGTSSHEDLIHYLQSSGALSSPLVIEAFQNVDRADFVPEGFAPEVYEDYPLHIGEGQTISQPSVVAMMMEMLDVHKAQKILDIGSGSGWTTALLAFMVGENGSVTGLERVRSLVEFGRENLKKYNFAHARILQAGDALGLPGESFERILVSAAAEKFPHALAKQLKIGGKLVIPVGNSIYEVTKNENGALEGVEHYGFTFVPLITRYEET
ncbi:protein-L-isoaspartate O-methyltransferase [bacterium]|nr:protein-L-isoaspartate O-methyltransferase [bacterium]MBU1989342.1 protein-L-isoaspartate O-methyltransferase [bacterium]